jgi:NAD-dependent deacetylase
MCATLNAYQNEPKRVQEFYNARRRPLISNLIKSNDAHNALVKLENEWSSRKRGQVIIVTQSIDNLHELAGSENLIHKHG